MIHAPFILICFDIRREKWWVVWGHWSWRSVGRGDNQKNGRETVEMALVRVWRTHRWVTLWNVFWAVWARRGGAGITVHQPRATATLMGGYAHRVLWNDNSYSVQVLGPPMLVHSLDMAPWTIMVVTGPHRPTACPAYPHSGLNSTFSPSVSWRNAQLTNFMWNAASLKDIYINNQKKYILSIFFSI